MQHLDKIILKNVSHNGILTLNSFFIQSKHEHNFLHFVKQILDLSTLGYKSAWDYTTKFMFKSNVLKIYFFFGHFNKILEDIKGFKFLIKSETSKQCLTFLLGDFPNRTQNLQITEIAKKISKGEVKSIRLVENGKIKNKTFIEPYPGVNCSNELFQDPTKSGEQI